MKKIVIMLLMLVSTNSFAWSLLGPKDYDECILENMKGVNTDVGARLVNESCSQKFKEKVVDNNQKDRWTLINAYDDVAEYYDKSTITRHGKIVTGVVMVDFDKRQSHPNGAFYSVVTLEEIDCGHLTSRYLSLEFKSGHMGEGNTVSSSVPYEENKITKDSEQYKAFCMN